jgi:CTP synthase (UTP-ammonia lyase)
MAAEENPHKRARITFRHGHRYEVEERVQPEHNEDESEQSAGDDDGNFHFSFELIGLVGF